MQRVSADLKARMPEAKCFSRVNLYYMVRFFKLYMPVEIVHQLGEQLDPVGTVPVMRKQVRPVFSNSMGAS